MTTEELTNHSQSYSLLLSSFFIYREHCVYYRCDGDCILCTRCIIVIEDIGAVINEMEMESDEDNCEESGEEVSHSLFSQGFEAMV